MTNLHVEQIIEGPTKILGSSRVCHWRFSPFPPLKIKSSSNTDHSASVKLLFSFAKEIPNLLSLVLSDFVGNK